MFSKFCSILYSYLASLGVGVNGHCLLVYKISPDLSGWVAKLYKIITNSAQSWRYSFGLDLAWQYPTMDRLYHSLRNFFEREKNNLIIAVAKLSKSMNNLGCAKFSFVGLGLMLGLGVTENLIGIKFQQHSLHTFCIIQIFIFVSFKQI